MNEKAGFNTSTYHLFTHAKTIPNAHISCHCVADVPIPEVPVHVNIPVLRATFIIRAKKYGTILTGMIQKITNKLTICINSNISIIS